MATVKVILKSEKKKKDGTIPLYLRIIKNRKATFIALGVSVKEADWNDEAKRVRKSHKNSGRLNSFIAQKVAEVEGKALEFETDKGPVSRFKIKREIMSQEPVDFFKFAEDYYNALDRAGKVGVYKKTKAVIKKLKDYYKRSLLPINEIDVEFLVKYQDFLTSTLKNQTNTITSNMKVIRKIMNDAVNQGKLDRNHNPFYSIKLHSEPSKREYLTEEELLNLEKLKLADKPFLSVTRDMYIFAAYTGGIRISDLLVMRWKNFDGALLNFKITKTGKELHIKMPDKALNILYRYAKKGSESSDLIFPVIPVDTDFNDPKKFFNAITYGTSQVNESLKLLAVMAKIEKKLSFHTSRHTFATRALRKGIRIEYVSKLLGHSNIKETQVYAKIVDKELEKAMDVFND